MWGEAERTLVLGKVLLRCEFKGVGFSARTFLVEEGIEDAGARLESVGDAEGGGFCFGGFGTGEVGVDRLTEEFYPAFELLFFERQDRMLRPGLAFVVTSPKKHFGPERIHGGKVMVPIDFCDVVEDRAKDLIAIHSVVKRIDQRLDVLLCGDVVQDTARYDMRWRFVI